MGKHGQALKESIGACALALDKGKVEGKVTDRLVRATFAAIERCTPQLRIDNIPNPFPAPHNLSWYFSACACPDDVRVFATRLSKGNNRVWSVAQATDGWKVLVQVFGAESQADAGRMVELEAKTPSLILKHHVMADASNFTFSAQNVDEFMHEHARVLLEKQGRGHFVELTLARRY